MRGRQHAHMRIDQEEREDLPVAGLSRVREFEGLDLMLEDIGKCERAALHARDAADVLDRVGAVFDAEDGFEPFVVALLIADVEGFLGAADLAEGEARGGDVFAVVVVQGCGADSFVLEV